MVVDPLKNFYIFTLQRQRPQWKKEWEEREDHRKAFNLCPIQWAGALWPPDLLRKLERAVQP